MVFIKDVKSILVGVGLKNMSDEKKKTNIWWMIKKKKNKKIKKFKLK